MKLTKRTLWRGGMVLILILAGHWACGQSVVYVDLAATGANNGSSWTDAYTNLANALSLTGSGTNIWVAQGIHYPTNVTNRSTTFQLKRGVSLYGGFTNGMATIGNRNWVMYPTILSGDIGVSGVETDNCYHVVKGATNASLDGFTITNGYAYGTTSADSYGAGMYNSDVVSQIVANCIFTGNNATNKGGGMYNYMSSLTVTGCTFRRNWASESAGMHNENASLTMSNCIVIDNMAWGGPGGMYNSGATATVVNCTFSSNRVEGYGGGMRNYGSKVTVSNCIFSGNRAGSGNAGMYNGSTTTIVVNCIFSGNLAGYYGGGGIGNWAGSSTTVSRCTFSGNSSDGGGYGGAGIVNVEATYVRVETCIFSGNRDRYYGGGIYNSYTPLMLINCLFNSNQIWQTTGSRGGGGMFNSGASATATVVNCIFWGNTAPLGTGKEFFNTNSSTLMLSYTDIEGGWNGTNIVNSSNSRVIDGGGNINAEPLFSSGSTGQWTSAGSYNLGVGQTILTDTTASWGGNELVGKTVNPAISQVLQFSIVSNNATTIMVWGNAETIATNGAPYQIFNYRLPNASPCINTGTNQDWMGVATDLDGHRRVDKFSGRVDMGAYEYVPRGTMFTVH